MNFKKLYLSFCGFLRKYFVLKNPVLLLGIASLLSGSLTFWLITHSEKTFLLILFLYADLILLLFLIVVIAKKLIELWGEQRKGLVGARLHVQIVVLFSFIALIPAICIAFFSALLFNMGIDTWFGKPVKNALTQAHIVSEAYLKEHQKAIMIDAHILINQLRPQVAVYLKDKELFQQALNDLADARALGEILVFNNHGRVLARSYLAFSLEIEKISLADFDKIRRGEIVVRKTEDRVRALAMLDPITETFLFVGKFIDPKVLSNISQTKDAVSDYFQLKEQFSNAQITFIAFFFLMALILLLSAIWAGLILANMLIKPVQKLLCAVETISQGDLDVRVEEQFFNSEFNHLARSFNSMAKRLKKQQRDLIMNQKKAVWSDIARKMAHEIKNPLTPIQLSAERLKRKYLNELKDKETFQTGIDTIIRHVSYIGNLINEFSLFARMPLPKLKKEFICEIISQTLFLQKQAYPTIKFICDQQEKNLIWMCDSQQITQMLINLFQNSINALIESNSKNPVIYISLFQENNFLYIIIKDNGPGFPKHNRERLMEPYYTTREKGTGLGLAIVSKIVSDHSGDMELKENNSGGACIELAFNLYDKW
ncbi:MAG: ATP-binding protein [Alphaproteobacteria bacterium]